MERNKEQNPDLPISFKHLLFAGYNAEKEQPFDFGEVHCYFQ
jgi:hypothetical protein